METVAMINPALVAKKQALEAALRQKTEELRQLCLKEAVSIFIELKCTDQCKIILAINKMHIVRTMHNV